MTNMECAIAVLAAHREARAWTDEAVATELLWQLGLTPDGVAANVAPPSDLAVAEAADAAAVAEEQARFEADAKADADRIAEIRATQAAQVAANRRPFFPNQRGGLANPPSGVQEPKS